MQETISKLTKELDSAGLSSANLDIDECLAFISDLVLSDSGVASENPGIQKSLNQLAGARPSRKVLESFWTSKKIEDKVKLLSKEHFKTKGAKVTIINKKQPKKAKLEPIKQTTTAPIENTYIKCLNLYNEITSRGCADTQYGWQLMLTHDDYMKLEEIIGEIDLSSDALPSYIYRLIAIYLGEFYKREYVGQKMGDRFSTSLCKAIINNTGIPVYSNKSYSTDEESHNSTKDTDDKHQSRWLDSIYVNGGLPIKAICNGKQKGISRLFEDIFTHTDEDWEIYLNDFFYKIRDDKVLASIALKQSLIRRESLYKLLIHLRNREAIFAKADIENHTGIFSEFMKLVEEGRKESERKKGKLMYELWYDIDAEQTFSLTPILHLSPEEDGKRHYAISPERLDVWGVNSTNSINYFTLSFQQDGNPIALYDEDFHTIDTILFNKCKKGDYIEFNARNKFYFPQLGEKDINIDSLFLKNYTCCFCGGEQEININLFPNKEDYIQFYSNDRKFWLSSKANVPYKYSALIFRNTKDCYLETGDYEIIGNGLAWTVFESFVTLVIKGRERRIYNAQGKVYAIPNKSFIHKLCESPFIPNLNGGYVNYRVGDSVESVYLVNDSKGIFDIFWEKDNKQIESGYKTYICSDSSQEYIEYNEGDLPIGYVRFKFQVFDKYTTEVSCFVLPSNCFVDMDLVSNKIIFRDIHLNVLHNNHLISKVGNGYTFTKKEFSDNELTKDGGYLTFEVQDKDGSIEISTPYPIAGIFYKLNGGTTINSKIKKIRTLPLAYTGYCRKIEINSNGAQFTRISNTIPKVYKYVLEQNRDRIFPNNETGRADGTTHFVAYSGMFQKETSRSYKIPGSRKIRTGSFYFLSLNTLKTHSLTILDNRIINLDDYKEEGILFQSLKNRQPLELYLRPEYIPSINLSKNIDKDRTKREWIIDR